MFVTRMCWWCRECTLFLHRLSLIKNYVENLVQKSSSSSSSTQAWARKRASTIIQPFAIRHLSGEKWQRNVNTKPIQRWHPLEWKIWPMPESCIAFALGSFLFVSLAFFCPRAQLFYPSVSTSKPDQVPHCSLWLAVNLASYLRLSLDHVTATNSETHWLDSHSPSVYICFFIDYQLHIWRIGYLFIVIFNLTVSPTQPNWTPSKCRRAIFTPHEDLPANVWLCVALIYFWFSSKYWLFSAIHPHHLTIQFHLQFTDAKVCVSCVLMQWV